MSANAKKLPDIVLDQEEGLSKSQYQFFADLMYQLSGVNLPFSSKNEALVKNRMSKLIRRNNIESYDTLIDMLKNPSQDLINRFVSALTTNKTHFFREEAHFEWFQQYLKKEHFSKYPTDLRVWCAAASTGQEPYTLAMVMRENIDPGNINKVKFLSTDIDLQVLNKASQGIYTENEMDGCPDTLRLKYFEKIKGGKELKYRAKDDIAKMVRFAPFNLMQPSYSFQHKFHVIFCRNVLIYFDPPTVKKVIDNLATCLVPGGYLILGHSESGTSKSALVKPMSRAIYQKV